MKFEKLLNELDSKDNKAKLLIAKKIRKYAYDEFYLAKKEELSSFDVASKIIKNLKMNDDKKFIVEMILAIGMISFRYKIKDEKIFNHIKLFFDIKNKEIKNAVVSALSHFDNKKKWDYLFSLLINKPNKQGKNDIAMVVSRYGNEMPSSKKEGICEKLINLYENDREFEDNDSISESHRRGC
ncbi:hypothetical protein PJW08_00250 (plasmid) [Tenacibaculum finnmarkense]|nr:hypothetical protein PJW08_00250 [Tenacibaculum finnmarkense]